MAVQLQDATSDIVKVSVTLLSLNIALVSIMITCIKMQVIPPESLVFMRKFIYDFIAFSKTSLFLFFATIIVGLFHEAGIADWLPKAYVTLFALGICSTSAVFYNVFYIVEILLQSP